MKTPEMGGITPEKNKTNIVDAEIKKMKSESEKKNSEINKLKINIEEKTSEIKKLEDELLLMGIVRVKKETYHHSHVAPAYGSPSISYEYGKPNDYRFNKEEIQGYISWKYFQETNISEKINQSSYDQDKAEKVVTEINKLKNEVIGIDIDLKKKIRILGELNNDISLLKKIAEKSNEEGNIELKKETYHHSHVAPGYDKKPSVSHENISSMEAFKKIKTGEQGSDFTSWKYFIG